MTALNKHTNLMLRTRINKGQSLLNREHKIMFAGWNSGYCEETGRTVSKFNKVDLIAAFTQTATLYKRQRALDVDTTFDTRTLSLVERTKRRAAAIRVVMADARDIAMSTSNTVRVKINKLRKA